MTCLISQSVAETEEFAAQLAGRLKPGDVLSLTGELGVGKTGFVRGLFSGLGGNPAYNVTSPTFTLLHEYPTKKGPLYHLDLYRLGNYREFYEAGLAECLEDKGFAVIEWGEKFEELNPSFTHRLSMKITGENERKIEILKPQRGTFGPCG